MSESFSIINKTKGKLPFENLPFAEIKNLALGENYELELVFVAPKESRKINRDFHHSDKPTNILSFPLSENAGQIFICPTYAKKEAPKFGRKFPNYIAFLFIHGVIHLKGFTHSSKMESEEQKIRDAFSI